MILDDQWIKPEVTLSKTQDGCQILENSIPLSACPANLCEWLHNHAETFPEKNFLLERNAQGGWDSLTYAKAQRLVNGISSRLLELQTDTIRPVAVLSQNCIKMALTQLAAMQVGIPIVPISYAYSVRSQTGSLVKHVLDVSGAGILIMSDADLHMPKISQWKTKDLLLYAFSNSESYKNVHSFDDLAEETDRLPALAKARFDAVTPQTTAKIQFTSGSTNLPKGVIVTHRMLTSNQTGIAQMWPFLDKNDVFLDWLPWNHTFGGNFVSNMVLKHGATFYIDNGNPTPEGFKITIENIKQVCPTVYFSVPMGYTALFTAMKQDEELKQAFFKNLKFIFTAAAALDQSTYQGLQAMSKEVKGTKIPFFAGWGTTETAPDATLVFWRTPDASVIGLPIPGVKIKLLDDPSGKIEVRVKGPNISPGYYQNKDATQKSFDDERYFITGDACKFLEPDNPAAGLVFDGRIGEDFKLDTGVWVNNANIRASINDLGKPYQLEVVLAAPNKSFLAALVFPNVPVLRQRFSDLSEACPEDAVFLAGQEVVDFFTDVFVKHNGKGFGSSGRIKRFCILTVPPRMDHNETTDKGYINQSAVLNHRADIVEKLFQQQPDKGIYNVAKH